jgi:cell shape-determining protein MreC
MKRPLLTYRRLRVALVLLLLLTSLLPRDWAQAAAAGPHYIVQNTVALLARPLTIFSDRLRPGRAALLELGAAQQAQDLVKSLVGENRRLREENASLRQQAKLTADRMEGVALVPVPVAAWSGDPLNPALTVSIPRGSGIAPRMAVVDDNHDLVGRVTAVSGAAATVRLITGMDPEVFAAPAGVTDEARGCDVRLHPQRNGLDLYAHEDYRTTVKVGDLASLSDPNWPSAARGYVVGQVVAVDPWPDSPALYRRIVVRPLAALEHLEHVSVLVPVASGGAR